MDVISAGASVVAFIVLGLKSAKIIHEILSNESGTHVGQVRAGIQDLQSTLERLQRCRATAELQDQAFQTKIQSCADNLTTFAATLQKLTVTNDGPRFANQLRRLRASWSEKELIRMSNVITRDAGTLKLYLQALESDTVSEIHDSLNATRQELSTFQTIKDDQSTLIAQHATLSATVRDSIMAVKDDLHLGFHESAVRSDEVLQKLVHLSDQSTAQNGEIIDQLAGLVANLNLRLEERSSVGEARDSVRLNEGTGTLDDTPAREVPAYNQLLESVQSVLDSARDQMGIFSSNDPEGIVDNLVKLLEDMMSDKFLRSATTYQHFCDGDTQEDLDQMRHTLRCLQGILLSSSRIAVNPRPVVNVLPIGSPVFTLVEQGRLVQFKEMLMRGEASLRDQDEFGVSLLFESIQLLLNNPLSLINTETITDNSGDLWDAVIAECGHDVLWYRKDSRPRKPKYRHGYTRQMFEEFWEGMEHLCPYYYDEFSEEINDDEGSRDSDGEESSHDDGEELRVVDAHDPLEEEGDDSDSEADDGGGCPLG
ncbi:hypothetical protein B0T26DRAFT_749992 [Lasiosphaeria miniovina]|uniref:Fungal N-terminal domain-containing protein n=1 Tax=Lasiosphaeria miniovina TaxID=1954250 RepID=A0AA40AVA2_9PEZI|nr:uncharacterized protein B0T26DRAFT_749992 [Lasiosphaeria miniovina]KAK0722619.1 hypothetical protein B0T26DRAFT_749992 [Lasiosphaeria miniovina]